MSPEAQRIAIAEACGLSPRKSWGGVIIDRLGYSIPDYLNDLNAMHDAIMSLDLGWRVEFKYKLELVVTPILNEMLGRCVPSTDALINATAAQRAEAFLRTLGKWEGGE